MSDKKVIMMNEDEVIDYLNEQTGCYWGMDRQQAYEYMALKIEELNNKLSEKDKRIDRLKFIIAKLVIKHNYDKTLFDLDDCKLIDEAMEVMK